MDKVTFPALELLNITRNYGAVQVLSDVSLTIQAGEAVAIIGPSGSGKSTLLHIAGLLDAADSGRVRLDGRQPSVLSDDNRAALRNSHCGFVYQFHHLLREFTALENVLMPAHMYGPLTAQKRARAEHLLISLGLEHRLHHLPSQLSGGEQQRVAIARALMNQPKLLLADEPTGNLDPYTAEGVTEALFKLVDEEGMAALIVTHNPALAARCHQTYVMHDGTLTLQPAKVSKPRPTRKKQA